MASSLHQSPYTRLRPELGHAINVLLIAGPLLNIHGILSLLPSLIQLIIIVALGLYIVKKLLTFRRWNDELKHVLTFVKSVLVLLLVVIIENFCTWATSASDIYKYSYTPLQDNVEIATLWLFKKIPLIQSIVMGWRVDMHWLLYSFVSLCLSVIWDQVPFSGFGMAARFMDAIAWTHALRTIAFMITVLPNPRPGCYIANFPPVPSTVWEFIQIGFSAKRGSGCNDLVISGHGVVYAAVPLALQTFYSPAASSSGAGHKRSIGWLAAPIAWLAVTKLCLQEVVDKTHYSVDMLLAVACTALVWNWRERVYPVNAAWKKRPSKAVADPVPRGLIALVVGVLVLVFVGVKGV